MLQPLHSVGLLLLAVAPLRAQFGNETIFVGRTGSTMYSFVDSASGAVVSGNDNQVRNVRGAVFADDGQNVYLGNAAPVFSLTGISRAQWNGSTAIWSTFYHTSTAVYYIGLDRARRRLWLLTNPTSTTALERQLQCLDVDTASATYGQLLAQTTSLAMTFRERWGLSPSGNLAAVPRGSVGDNLFEIVDTNPTSPTFLQVTTAVPLSATSPGSGYVMGAAISGDDQYAYVLVPGIAPYVGVLHIPSQTWLDFDAAGGQQHLMLPPMTPTALALAPDASYAVVTAYQGAARRVVFDYQNPSQSTVVDAVTSMTVTTSDSPSVSFDSTRIAFSGSGALLIVDAATGTVLQSVAGVGGISTAWQDRRPGASYTSYGAGCAGTLGVPTLAAAAASPVPVLGSTFSLAIGNLPAGIGLVGFGFSNTSWNGLPLPLPLTAYGIPACSLWASPDSTGLVLGSPTATWSLSIPNWSGLFGMPFYNQAFSLDAGANALGLTVSNAGAGVLGI